MKDKAGTEMYALLERLFPICRSITGNGVRETLAILKENIPIRIVEVASGTKVFDWTVPDEWNVRDAYVMDEAGHKVIDFKKHNLHLVGYSTPLDETMPLFELQEHLYSLEEQPDAIPYITSYYKARWGFCLTHNERAKLKAGNYRVVIDSELKAGSLTYGELLIPGELEDEIFISTYVCHPSMANNELSGPVVATQLVKWLMEQPRKYSYRIIFIPETIGSITYLSNNLSHLQDYMVAGFNLSCVGDDRDYSYLPTRYGKSYSDRVMKNVLENRSETFQTWSYLDRGSDERQYNAPGVDLPVVSFSRSRYGTFPEYHTSLDNLDLVSAKGLQGSLEVLMACIELIERNTIYMVNVLCEPQMGKRGLYSTKSQFGSYTPNIKQMMDFIAYADGTNDLIDISNIIGVPVWDLYPIVDSLLESDLLEEVKIPVEDLSI